MPPFPKKSSLPAVFFKRTRMIILIGVLLLLLLLAAALSADRRSGHRSLVQRFTQPTQNSANASAAATACTTGCSAGGGGGGTSTKQLLPVNDAMHNVREIVKQMLLLEDHLFQKEKQCRMCITKHMLTIEALAEEAVTLEDADAAAKRRRSAELQIVQNMQGVASRMRDLHVAFKKTTDSDADKMAGIAQSVREMRRQLMSLA